jgi:glucokinase
VATERHVLAVDAGGSQIKATVLDAGPDGALTAVARARRPTPKGADGTATAHAIVAAVADLAAGFAATQPISAVGVVVPGVVHDGVGVYSANLGWRNFPFATTLAEVTGLPVAFGHDVAAGGLAELRMGAARGYQDVVVMPIGTGIAAALVMDGALRTSGGYAGEIGHVDVGHGERCGCGLTGCLEAMASAAAIARRYSAKAGRQVDGSAEVVDAATAGDPVAVEVWNDALDALARGIRVLATLIGPEVVVLGGGVAMAGDRLVDPLAERLAGLLTFQRMPRLRLAELGDQAGSLGAGLLAIDLIDKEAAP